MIELILCSLLTVFPDYLYCRYAQGKRIGREITLYSVWFELRVGITACLMLTVTLITIIFYHHPATHNVTYFFRTIPIVPEVSGRVAEIFVKASDEVAKGAPIFKLDSSTQQAAVESARLRIVEADAAMVVARADISGSDGRIQQAKGAYEQALEELQTKQELQRRNPGIVATRDIEKLQNLVEGRQGGIMTATAEKQAAEAKLSTLLPAQKASAEAALAQAQVELAKTTVYAGVSGRVEQFGLKVGDVVNPFMRPAGLLIPNETSSRQLQAGFGQIEAQVMKVGMAAEVTCASKPLTIIPMVVVDVQDFIAAGQFRISDQLVDIQQSAKGGTITVFLEPMYEGGLNGVTRGSSCIANAYTNNHELLASKDVGLARRVYLHVVDTVAIVHAMILRVQALLLPVQTLVLAGH
ncbi:MAG: biotin/lipoyl-binding protein [Hyphomicrobiales bacterium]